MCDWCGWGRYDVECRDRTDPHLTEQDIEPFYDADGRL